MKWLRLLLAAALVSMAMPTVPALALQPDEVLANPGLEARAREISAGLRCMVCQNQSIDDSDAALARDLRILVRERLLAGDTDEQVVAFIVARYGEYVLLRPRFSWGNAVLWATPGLLLVAGVAFLFYALRRRRAAVAGAPPARLTPEENAALERLLRDAG